MSARTWTARALATETRRFEGKAWRAVEAQHIASTLRLVDSGLRGAQALLEEMLERSKPGSAEAKLDYLLTTPFRYPSAMGSRFGEPGQFGYWYGALACRTALAERSYWMWRFWQAAPTAQRSRNAVALTLFQAALRTKQALDLTRPPLSAAHKGWTDPVDYTATRKLASEARKADVQLMVYESVRDPERAPALVAFNPQAFARGKPTAYQTWFAYVSATGAAVSRTGLQERHEFQFD